MRGQKIRRIWRQRTGGNSREIGYRGMRHGHQVQRRHPREIRTEASVFSGTEVEEPANTRLAEVRIDQNGFITELRQGNGEICRSGGFAFAGQRAGYQDDLRWMVRL